MTGSTRAVLRPIDVIFSRISGNFDVDLTLSDLIHEWCVLVYIIMAFKPVDMLKMSTFWPPLDDWDQAVGRCDGRTDIALTLIR